jgi:hypothetical protein
VWRAVSAEVRPVYVAYCDECMQGYGPEDDMSDVEAWATEHDAEYHNEPDREDADYEHFKESLREP